MTEDEMVGRRHRPDGHELRKPQEMVKDGEAWPATARGVTKSQRQVSHQTTAATVLERRCCHHNILMVIQLPFGDRSNPAITSGAVIMLLP